MLSLPIVCKSPRRSPSHRAAWSSAVRVLHDWDDSSARILLRRAHQVLNPGGTLLICEPLQVEDSFSLDADAAAYSFMCALIGGKRRSFCEFQTMLGEAGFGTISRKPLGVYSNTVIQAKA